MQTACPDRDQADQVYELTSYGIWGNNIKIKLVLMNIIYNENEAISSIGFLVADSWARTRHWLGPKGKTLAAPHVELRMSRCEHERFGSVLTNTYDDNTRRSGPKLNNRKTCLIELMVVNSINPHLTIRVGGCLVVVRFGCMSLPLPV